MHFVPEDLLKLALAVLAGGLIGAEREYRDKAAGFRTLIFITIGAAAFTVFSARMGGPGDPARIAANVVSGVGFLGAGAILRDRGRVVGLTTAATIWLCAALGMGIGAGEYALAGAATAASLVVLWLFPTIERRIDRIRDSHSYEVVSKLDPDHLREIEGLFRESGLAVNSRKHQKRGNQVVTVWNTIGPPADHERLVERLLATECVEEFQA